MKLILPTDFKDLQDNDNHFYDVDNNSGREVLKIYSPEEKLIAKRIKKTNKNKRTVEFYGVKGYEEFLTEAYLEQKRLREERLKKKK